MTENDDRIGQLIDRLESLLKRQDSFSNEISQLRSDINDLKALQERQSSAKKIGSVADQVEVKTVIEPQRVIQSPVSEMMPENAPREQQKYNPPEVTLTEIKSDIEKFIGENLINKIGIAITVIGVAIGAKYSIEHQLISPLTRIILGYLVALGLLAFGIRLKKNYMNYSAVLVSGAMAILYFITYSAYSFYDLLPQVLAFTLMVIFTVFTVVAAIQYDRQVIAHIGLVGAYAVPFLLSENSGRIVILFSYMAIINVGILIIAFKKYWKPLHYSSFVFTWLIFFVWYLSKYQVTDHFGLSLIFLSVFFVTFYLIFLAYKLLQKKIFEPIDIILLLANSFIFFGLGYSVLKAHTTGAHWLGLFTLFNAMMHFGVAITVKRQKLADRNLFLLVAGLAWVFTTIAIPVQLDGNWVTLLWACEAALLFWIGRYRNVPAYEKISYALMLLAFISILQDWLTQYSEHPAARFIPFLNIGFLTAVIFIAAFVIITYFNGKIMQTSSLHSYEALDSIMAYSIPGILLIVLYFTFRLEISACLDQLYSDSALRIKNNSSTIRNDDLRIFKTIWMLNYSLLFLTVLSFVNIRKIKSNHLGFINLGLNAFLLILFLTQGLYSLSELRDSFVNQTLAEYYHKGLFYIAIRYISFAFAGLVLACNYIYISRDFLKPVSSGLLSAVDLIFYTSVLWIASSELISWMDIMKSPQSYKLGLSILWGCYALLLIALGIWKMKIHLRIGAIVLFTVTLMKLFFYDISHLNTIEKTIVFVSLGILLLIISFLYNKYHKRLSGEVNNWHQR